MPENKSKNQLLLLHKNDNILICCRNIRPQQQVQIDSEKVSLTQHIEIGHKVARVDIKKNQKIYKYGVAIGSALEHINRGEHVHLHNMKSDYIPSHTRAGLTSESNNSKGAANE
ncbi:altronate hydrolase [Parashewanella spongiae]|uniref:Altronate hydrolase n=1 Tax=Parashewanella spongiae TaxID=342950 RepID=A0A3A6TQY2_9GAMM|nr:UxaA family hydrolase [Parashewanella spongiae]MCL1077943.1 UxaA family hydrolase [Parashewanella spongiae]RJY18437.1 altronate hydrolase [Parashewanella spongiae]